MILQIIGLPGSGKTALAKLLAERLNAIVLNGDDVRASLSSDLSFSLADRLEQARRMGCVARLISGQGFTVIADFVCPTAETRQAFGNPDLLVWVNRIDRSRYSDTNALWEDPEECFMIGPDLTVDEEADLVIQKFGLFDWKKPTTLMLGRYQPWHAGHRYLYDVAREDPVLVGVRATSGTSEKDPFTYDQVAAFIREDVEDACIMRLPNITRIVYGRDVGYRIDKIEVPDDVASISATDIRNNMNVSDE